MIRQRIAEIMKERDIRNYELARRMGVSQQYVAQLLAEGCSKLSTMERVADALGIPVVALLQEGERTGAPFRPYVGDEWSRTADAPYYLTYAQ